MRLKDVTIHNFRGFSQRTTIPIDECITGFIGKNDAGKSSILEAIGIFFNADAVSLDKDDFNVAAPNCPIEITCVFDNLPDEALIDDSNTTTLSNEYLLNQNNELEIKKLYKRTQPKAPRVFIRANHPTAPGYEGLHNNDINSLKNIAKELSIDPNTIEDHRKSALWRKSIWDHCENLNLQLVELEISAFEGESKRLQDKIQKLLPLYQLFKVDRETKDNDPIAKSPLQDAVELAKNEFADRISTLEEEIKSKVIERAQATLEKLKEMDPALASSLVPRFKSAPKWTFDFTLDGDDNIPINKRGSGVRRLVLLNFFRAEAERKIVSERAPSVIYAFEEPETSQHPDYQEMLMNAFFQISQKDNCQVLITTHVPALGALLPISGLRMVTKSTSRTDVEYGNDDILQKIADTLGVLPNPIPKGVKAIVLVEGSSDITFFDHLAKLLKDNGYTSHTFNDKKIALLICGGCGTLKHWRAKKIVEQFDIPWGVVLDSDLNNPTNNRMNKKHVDELKADSIKAYLTRKCEIENYIDESVLGVPVGSVVISDSNDAKRGIAYATKTRPADVIDKYWTLMTIDLIRAKEKYVEDGNVHYELTEMVEDFLSMVPD